MATRADRGDAATGSRQAADRILEPGATCWRLARADRLAIVVDAAAYFRALKDAILRARQSVLLIGWDFDMRIALAPEEHSEVPDRLDEFLSHVVERNPDVRIRVLRWDLSLVKMPLRATLPLALLDLLQGPRIVLRLDHAHPAAACHHQKIAVIDDALAFCGGIDVTLGRWDTSAHRDDDPNRVHPSGEPYGPWHDATVAVSGDAARVLGELARARWRTATGEQLPAPDPREPLWPEALDVDLRDADVAVARTQAAYREEPEIREIEALYLRAIATARRWIYIETQYFASQRIADAIAARLRERDGPEIVIVNPVRADGWLEEKAMGSARAILVRDLSRIAPVDRFRIYHPVNASGTSIYVHAKIMIVDDVLVRVGSSNLNNRSMGFDTEADLALEAGRPEETRFVAHLRNRLLAEHLATTPEAVADALAEGGSLIAAIERLRRPGRTLIDYALPTLAAPEEAFARSGVADPDRPESMSTSLAKAWRAARRAGGWPRLMPSRHALQRGFRTLLKEVRRRSLTDPTP